MSLPTAAEVRRSWGLALIYVGLAVALGWMIGRALEAVFGLDRRGWASLLQYAGIGLLLWATLGDAGWSIQTPNGESDAEVLNKRIIRVLHCTGSLLLAVSVSWDPAPRYA